MPQILPAAVPQNSAPYPPPPQLSPFVFLLLKAYQYLAKRNWNLGIVRLFNDILYEEGLSADTIGKE